VKKLARQLDAARLRPRCACVLSVSFANAQLRRGYRQSSLISSGPVIDWMSLALPR
jgi:hypothetical protein